LVTYPLVDFLIGGVQRGGTTAMYRYLRNHPGIAMSSPKEVHHFDTSKMPSIHEYHAHWNGRQGLWGEGTPSYFYYKTIPALVFEYNPDIKAIFLLRHPVDRAFSHYKMMVRRGRIKLPFRDALERDTVPTKSNRLRACGPKFGIIQRGFYGRQIANWAKLFPREHLLFLRSDNFVADRHETLHKVCEFLEIDDHPSVPDDPPYVANYAPLAGDLRQELLKRFAGDVKWVENFTGWDLDEWRR